MMVLDEKALNYREATLFDEEIVKTLHMAMLRELSEYNNDIVASKQNVDKFWDSVFRPCILDDYGGIVICENALGNPIGIVMVCPMSSWIHTAKATAMDWGCYVVPNHRRKGVATELRRMAFDNMKLFGFESVVSKVLTFNDAGMKSYEKVGAKITGYDMEVTL